MPNVEDFQYDPSEHTRWTHDDNMLAQERGWLIMLDNQNLYQIIPLDANPGMIYHEQILPFVETDALAGKAYAFLLGQRMMMPDGIYPYLRHDPYKHYSRTYQRHRRAIETLENARERLLAASCGMQDWVGAGKSTG